MDGKTEFFNGRHRTALLFKHLDELPISFNTKLDEKKCLLAKIPKRPLKQSDRLFIPNFTIWEDKDSMLAGSEAPVRLFEWASDPEVRKIMNPPPDSRVQVRVNYTINFGKNGFEYHT